MRCFLIMFEGSVYAAYTFVYWYFIGVSLFNCNPVRAEALIGAVLFPRPKGWGYALFLSKSECNGYAMFTFEGMNETRVFRVLKILQHKANFITYRFSFRICICLRRGISHRYQYRECSHEVAPEFYRYCRATRNRVVSW